MHLQINVNPANQVSISIKSTTHVKSALNPHRLLLEQSVFLAHQIAFTIRLLRNVHFAHKVKLSTLGLKDVNVQINILIILGFLVLNVILIISGGMLKTLHVRCVH